MNQQDSNPTQDSGASVLQNRSVKILLYLAGSAVLLSFIGFILVLVAISKDTPEIERGKILNSSQQNKIQDIGSSLTQKKPEDSSHKAEISFAKCLSLVADYDKEFVNILHDQTIENGSEFAPISDAKFNEKQKKSVADLAKKKADLLAKINSTRQSYRLIRLKGCAAGNEPYFIEDIPDFSKAVLEILSDHHELMKKWNTETLIK